MTSGTLLSRLSASFSKAIQTFLAADNPSDPFPLPPPIFAKAFPLASFPLAQWQCSDFTDLPFPEQHPLAVL
eukprot:3631738-Rhodomonas_salina.2